MFYQMRLVFHWTAKVTFRGDVRLYIKGKLQGLAIFDMRLNVI